MTDEEFISLPDAAQLLFVSRSHVAKLVSSGMFTTRQDGAMRRSDVLEYKASKRAEAEAFFETQTEDDKPEDRFWWQNVERRAARARRRLVRNGALLSTNAFCRRRGISPAHLVRLERQGDVFAVTIDHKAYYPAVFADTSHDMHRLAKLCRQLGPHVPAMTRYHFFVTRWVSLGKKTPLQALHRGRRYAWALRKADGIADEHMPPTIKGIGR